MRRKRIKAEGCGVYHCISRAVAGAFLFDDAAREQLRRMLWRVAAFSGVEVLTYCVLSNHFHVLVRVCPAGEQTGLDRAEILRRYRAFYSVSPSLGYPTPEVLQAIFDAGGEEAAKWEERLKVRMGDVSEFMKTLKQRFTTWYNQKHERFGTLWAERFTSVLVENSAFSLKTVAAYIDLNAVRAGLVADPGDYRWCGYAEAMDGSEDALHGLRAVADVTSPREALESYRVALFGKGSIRRRESERVIDWAAAKKILEKGGRLDRSTLLRFRLRYLSRGLVLGSKGFVEKWKSQTRLGSVPLAPDEGEPGLATLSRGRRTHRDTFGV